MNVILSRFLKLILLTILIHITYYSNGAQKQDIDVELFKDISAKLDFIINFLKTPFANATLWFYDTSTS